MVLSKFAKFCLLENFNKMDIIRTFTKINSFHSETNRPSAYYEETKSFFLFQLKCLYRLCVLMF
jgi:hypothetical protein